MLNLPIHLLSQVFHNRVTGFIFILQEVWDWNPQVLEGKDWTTLVLVELRFPGGPLPSYHSLPCFQESACPLDAAQALLQLAMLFEGLSSSKGISNFSRRVIIVPDVCKTQVYPHHASAWGMCLGLSKVTSPTGVAAGLGGLCSAEEKTNQTRNFRERLHCSHQFLMHLIGPCKYLLA